MNEIKENEIRIIGQTQPYRPHPNSIPKSSGRRPRYIWLLITLIILLIIGFASALFFNRAKKEPIVEIITNKASDKTLPSLTVDYEQYEYCSIEKIIVNDIPLKIYCPGNTVPSLLVGKLDSASPGLVLAFQAADIREDNGGIVGACIKDGEIISKGLSKLGFVAMINGKITIGAELNSPYFEEAIESNGSFFRQYALVKDGMIIENNLKNKSVRRALCSLEDDGIVVVETESRESFHDFSQALVDYGVCNAVYLVGSSAAHGFCRTASQSIEEWGDPTIDQQKNVTYIVWKSR